MKYGEINLGQVEAIINKLGGKEGALRFLRGELVVLPAKPVEAPVWKTVKLGTCKTSAAYRKALKNAGMRVSDEGDDILGRVTCASEEIDLDLVVLSLGDLGLKDRTPYMDICSKAKEFGLELCPAEVGPALRLQYNDQPDGEWFGIAMKAITNRNGDLRTFVVGCNDDGLQLAGGYGHPNEIWFSGNRFIFVRRK